MLRALVFCWIALVSFAALAEDSSPPEPEGMVLLTVGGLVGKPNRGPIDKKRDSALAKLKADFKHGFSFDRNMLTRRITSSPLRRTETPLASTARDRSG